MVGAAAWAASGSAAGLPVAVAAKGPGCGAGRGGPWVHRSGGGGRGIWGGHSRRGVVKIPRNFGFHGFSQLIQHSQHWLRLSKLSQHRLLCHMGLHMFEFEFVGFANSIELRFLWAARYPMNNADLIGLKSALSRHAHVAAGPRELSV